MKDREKERQAYQLETLQTELREIKHVQAYQLETLQSELREMKQILFTLSTSSKDQHSSLQTNLGFKSHSTL